MEEKLVDHVSRGERLDLTAGEAGDEASMRAWGKSRTCHATVLRDILLGRLVACPEPHGLRLKGARISGQLDLQNLVTSINFELSDCLLEAGILAQDAQLAGVRLHGCQIEHPTEPPLNATRFTCSMLSLIGTRITGHAASGAVNLVDAHIGGKLDFTGASLSNDSGPALNAVSLQADRDVSLRGGFAGAGHLGAVSLFGAHIGGKLDFIGASLSNDSGPALTAGSLQSSGDMFLLRGRFTGAGPLGAVYLNNAHIGGELNCTEASLRNDSGPALSAESLQVDHGIFLRRFAATAAGPPSAVVLAGAHIGGQLVCEGAVLSNNSGPALIADGLQVDHDMVFNGGFTATGGGGTGAVSLIGAHIRGQLACQEASLRNDSGPALSADNLQADHDMILCAFTVTGAGQDAAVSLVSAHIGRQLACRGASLRNDSGPVLSAASLKVDQEMFLTGEVTGVSRRPAVSLIGAQIDGQLVCEGLSLHNDSGPALAADGLHVGREMLLRGEFTAVGSGGDGTVRLLGARIDGQLDFTGARLSNDSGGGGDGVVVDLTDARIAGALTFDPALVEHAVNPHLRLKVDGLTYAGVPDLGPTWNWLKLLKDATPSYQAQPYQQLAAAHRALGAERQVRKILMAQRDDQLDRTGPGWPERLWGRITKLTLGYGYQPWRALLFLTGVVALSCALAVVLGSHGALAQTRSTAAPGRPCTTIQQISVGLDLNLPVGTTLARANCDLTMDPASVAAAWLTAESWVLRILAWVFAALFIAGFTSAVRKT